MPDVSPLPFTPPIATADLPGTGGAIGKDPEDFNVDEVPLYPFSGTGEHLLVRFEKRGLTTRDAVSALARAANVPAAEIGTAGMKDKHAVTAQWASLPARRAGDPASWALPPGMRVLEATRHGNKLRTGHARGNRFKIRVVGAATDALSRAEAIVSQLRAGGLPNYFGAQRFGHGGGNVAEALAWIAGGGRAGRFEKKLLSSVLQSEVFNRYVALRLAEDLSRPFAGEVVRLSTSSAVFVVEDPDAELPRWASRDIVPTGPMIGPKLRAAGGRPLELERAAVAASGLDEVTSAALGRYADGTRRDALVFLDDVRVQQEDAASGTYVLEFFLPAGSYATQLVRELTREPFLAEGGRRGATDDP